MLKFPRQLAPKGFTLIELMIVVAIIGILAAIAIPNFVKFQCRSKQSEAKTSLKSLYVSEESYRAEWDKYIAVASCGVANDCGTAGKGAEIGWEPKGSKLRYNYATGTIGATEGALTFDATATGTGEVKDDKWSINQANSLQLVVNSCD